MKNLNKTINIKKVGSNKMEYTLSYFFDEWTKKEMYVITNPFGFGVFSNTSLSKCKKVLNDL